MEKAGRHRESLVREFFGIEEENVVVEIFNVIAKCPVEKGACGSFFGGKVPKNRRYEKEKPRERAGAKGF